MARTSANYFKLGGAESLILGGGQGNYIISQARSLLRPRDLCRAAICTRIVTRDLLSIGLPEIHRAAQ